MGRWESDGGLTGGSCHIFYKDRAVNVVDGIPKWTGHKDESELMPETEEEEKREEEEKDKEREKEQ